VKAIFSFKDGKKEKERGLFWIFIFLPVFFPRHQSRGAFTVIKNFWMKKFSLTTRRPAISSAFTAERSYRRAQALLPMFSKYTRRQSRSALFFIEVFCSTFMCRVPNAKEGRDSIEIGVYGMENIPDEFLDEEERDAKRRKDETGRPGLPPGLPVMPVVAVPPMLPGMYPGAPGVENLQICANRFLAQGLVLRAGQQQCTHTSHRVTPLLD